MTRSSKQLYLMSHSANLSRFSWAVNSQTFLLPVFFSIRPEARGRKRGGCAVMRAPGSPGRLATGAASCFVGVQKNGRTPPPPKRTWDDAPAAMVGRERQHMLGDMRPRAVHAAHTRPHLQVGKGNMGWRVCREACEGLRSWCPRQRFESTTGIVQEEEEGCRVKWNCGDKS